MNKRCSICKKVFKTSMHDRTICFSCLEPFPNKAKKNIPIKQIDSLLELFKEEQKTKPFFNKKQLKTLFKKRNDLEEFEWNNQLIV